MKIAKITLLVASILTLGVFLLGKQMTPIPGTTSGNGNPALLLLLILIPLFVLMVILWIRIFNVHLFSNNVLIIGILCIFIHLTVGFLYQRNALIEYRQIIKDALLKKEGVVDAEYLQSITSVLSIHVNNQYYNLNTFFMFITFSILVAIVYTIWEKKEKVNWEKKAASK